MASRRALGGGRVLGTGKNLAPPPSTPKPTAVRNTGLLSPSESSVSLSSHASSTPITENEDLTARVAVDEHGLAQAAAAASSRMVCPICNEEMVTLLQLNRHIDDNHANLEEIEQDEAKTWFKQQMVKAKKFQPLQMLNQKLRGLDVFESNNDIPTSTPPKISRTASPARTPAPPPTESKPDPDDLITRSHWQRPTGHDSCSDPMCGKRLGTVLGQINCRHCGKLFCDEHTMYQMKLSRSAQHEPVRGMWYRVCETCYKSREGYNDHTGSERNHFGYFKSVRRKTVDKEYLETSRLETRLTRLTQLLANPPPPEQGQSLWSSLSGNNKQHLRALEQAIVAWEDDALVNECPFCMQPFSQYSLRRHHCRTCGRVVCGDPATKCSGEIGLDVETTNSEKPNGKVAVDVRICKDCQRTIFSKADFARELNTQTPDQRAFHNLTQFEHGIRLLLPKFQRLLVTLQDPEKPPTPAQLAEASKVRKRLTDAFTQYDVAARRIRDMPTQSPTQQRLQKAVYQQATTFLHIHMLPLKSLPKILKHATPRGMHVLDGQKPQGGALAAIKYNDLNGRGHGSRPSISSVASSTSSAAITALEAEERDLRSRMIVLEEQKFFVSEMIADANKRRKFDEVAALAQNVEDLSREIDQIQSRISQMDFAGAYAGDEGVIK
ncbi:Vacuolar segregation protein PEP7 [Acrodontium crateriforme]|uniref:Vacuolar segregation protein PEP7 n=1 Tax=Acrodontium crateriforme TaxID=150365 RepID=A0AAQ3LYN6_9PEZI|nr:Vacuolar segregation protein PEP7 [Acrodontium crateriforme]